MKRFISYLLIAIMTSMLLFPTIAFAGDSSATVQKGSGKATMKENWSTGTKKKGETLEEDLQSKSKPEKIAPRSYPSDVILPKEELVGGVYSRGGTIVLPFNLYSYGNYGQKYFVNIYDSSGSWMGGTSGDFPTWYDITTLRVSWNTAGKGRGKYYVECYATHPSMGDEYLWPIYLKDNQKISASNINKTFGISSFKPTIKTSGNGALSYKSSDTKVATISSKGVLTVKGPGITTLTVNANATNEYRAATKKITVTIKPAKMKLSKVVSSKKKQMKVTWKKDAKATGYQLVYATNSKFTSGKKSVTISKNSTKSKTISKLKSKKTYYVKSRSYKVVKGSKIYGAYSAAKKVKVK